VSDSPIGPAPSALEAGLRGRCPRCGRGELFAGFLRLKPACGVCGADFSRADSGDGPAFFVMFAVGAIVVPIGFLLQFGLHLGPIITLGVVTLLTFALSFALLRPAKALLFALQWRHRAGE